MFCLQFKEKGKPPRYFHPSKGLQKTIKTAWMLPETHRKEFENAAKNNPTWHIITIPVSAIAETMYMNGVQKNKIKW